MGGRAPKGPFKGISSQRTAKGHVIGRLKCPSRKCDGDALAKVDGMGWLQATHQGCTSLTGRSYAAAHDILERVGEYPDAQKWATTKSEAEAKAALQSMLDPAEPKAPKGPVFVAPEPAEAQPDLTAQASAHISQLEPTAPKSKPKPKEAKAENPLEVE